MADNLNLIEETLAHQEKQIQDLSDTVSRQWEEIDLLKKHLEKLQDKIDQVGNSASGENPETLSVTEQAARDKPPHY